MSHHKIALIVVAAAIILDIICGILYSRAENIPLWHGMYCALANAVTVGGDVSPHNISGYIINAVECFLIVPLFAATFSLFTSALSAVHVRKAEANIKQHIENKLLNNGE